MQSKISLVSREIWKTILRSVGWVSILYFLGLFIAVPLEILMTESKYEEHRYFIRIENLFQSNAEIQTVLSIALPVLLAIFLFRFLQVKHFSDFMHSLPLKRERIYHVFTLLGAVILITPVILNSLIVLIIYGPLDLQETLSIGDVFQWMGITIMFNLVIYMAAVFVAMITGLSVVQGGLTYILLLLPIGLIMLFSFNLPFYLYGFPEQYFMENKIDSISPLVALSLINERPVGWGEIIIYILLIFTLYGASLWIYKHRRLEAVSQALIFPFMKPIFKYGATFCSMLLGGMYFGKMEGGTLWLIAGYLFGSILGYFIAEMVLQKSWRIIIHIRGFLIYACTMAVLFILFQFDFTQYEKNIPYTSEIERVHFGNSYYRFIDSETEPYYLEDTDNIELIRRLHKEIVANKGESPSSRDSAFFVYELTNGKRIIRNYEIDKNKYAQFYKLIYESQEYKRVTNEIFQVKEDQIEKITIQPFGPVSKRSIIVDPTEMEEAISILKDEINQATYEEIQDDRDAYSVIEIFQRNDKTAMMQWRVSYEKFEQWLSEKGLLENARVNASDIDTAYIAPKDELDIDFRGFSHEEVFNQMENISNVLKITDKTMLETTLEDTKGYIDGPYVVAIKYKNDRYIDIKSFSSDRVPDFVKQYFE
ncbi:DUF6449 domain-containing protein [Bacillus sp. DTU_2020_1000418_1_SI_GHA_SEK_038]|uniref:DUF6449 domain-containing protein n=1 Tax=Bacillus sp. DTU_2020_1000418_1_SI_GHA_SEK_038 TaxID=3077585 RepID=UPI0028E957CE|nr:DUF6449 domain-containing protein [Bacillus sp. DTU_2020_1000418_1_SI_GHA_SEK_038]WNS73761.1 DUF6449 domain-containing protein [Bacillus sp. DTU_2020_1000418_1_SI_GHA_SEK_038]